LRTILPIPLPPPVTTTTLPSTEKSCPDIAFDEFDRSGENESEVSESLLMVESVDRVLLELLKVLG